MNLGQLSHGCCAPSTWSTPSRYNKVQGKPFKVSEILARIERELAH
jgi:hypothetical protein